MARFLTSAILCFTFLIGLALAASALTHAQWDRNRVNAVRYAHHKHRLYARKILTTRAYRWAHHLADRSVLADDESGSDSCWRIGGRVYGSNVGYGPSVWLIERAMEHSREHLANILESRFRWFGVAVVHKGGYYWLVQDYCG